MNQPVPLQTVETTVNALLNGKVMVRQPKEGYRVGMDAVFLAASLHVEPRETVLDVGTGVGSAMLCLGWRTGCKVVGIDFQRPLVRLAADNIRLNQMEDRLQVIAADLLQPPPRLAPGSFHHVMSNPPYVAAQAGTIASNLMKALSHQETTADLKQWVYFCSLMLRPKGTVTFVHRADRLDDVLIALKGGFGETVVYPLWPGVGKAAKRVLIRAIKGSAGGLYLSQGLILHDRSGRPTDGAVRVLRMGMGLDLLQTVL